MYDFIHQDEDQERLDLFEFDIQHEVKELINRYQKRINMNYHHSEIDDLKMKEVYGKINKYIFMQADIGNQYKIKLKNLRRAIEGVKFFGNHNMCQMSDQKTSFMSDSTIKEPIIQFFNSMDI